MFIMEIKLSDKYCILAPTVKKIDAEESKLIENELSYYKEVKIALDMEAVQELTIDFIEKISKFTNLSFFNINSDVFALLTFMKLDKCLNLYVTEEDFVTGTHRVLSRNFTLV